MALMSDKSLWIYFYSKFASLCSLIFVIIFLILITTQICVEGFHVQDKLCENYGSLK